MTEKNTNWEKAWTRLPSGRLRHVSGAEFIIEAGDGFIDIDAAPDTLAEYQRYEFARGVSPDELAQRLMRLAHEAGDWLKANP
jgi:hypothetical protein